MKTRILAALIIVFMVLPVLPLSAAEYTLTGKTMGTFYRIKFLSNQPLSTQLWQKKVDLRLREVSGRLSMYQKDSEISRFNRSPGNKAFRLSKDFYRVLVQCETLYQQTRGAWDGTVKPLVDLWGFGTKGRPNTLPDDQQIKKALDHIGFNKLILGDRTLVKQTPDITLDLGSIAKGYGVDEIARLFAMANLENYLVEIGGELRGSGKNKKGTPWVVGISKPDKKGLNPGLYQVVSLDNMAIATSGNYRNFFEKEGKTFSHIIDPKTGYPVGNQVVSASVIAETCTLADGLATALMVMDSDQGVELVNRMDNTECLIIKKQGERLITVRSKGFSALEKKQPSGQQQGW